MNNFFLYIDENYVKNVKMLKSMPFFNASQLSNNIFGPGLMNMNQNLMNEALQCKAHFENSPNELQFILHQDPKLAQAVLSDDIRVLMDLLAQRVFYSIL